VTDLALNRFDLALPVGRKLQILVPNTLVTTGLHRRRQVAGKSVAQLVGGQMEHVLGIGEPALLSHERAQSVAES
jgi:hypothetical protein